MTDVEDCMYWLHVPVQEIGWGARSPILSCPVLSGYSQDTSHSGACLFANSWRSLCSMASRYHDHMLGQSSLYARTVHVHHLSTVQCISDKLCYTNTLTVLIEQDCIDRW